MRKSLRFLCVFVCQLCCFSAFAAVSTTADFDNFARSIASEFSERRTASFDDALDAGQIISTALNDLALDAAWKRGIQTELNTAIKTRLGAKLISQMPEGAYAKLVRTKIDAKKTLSLLRIDYGDSGTGYIDLHLVRGIDGKMKIVDWYDYSTGQLYTQSIRQLIALMSPTPTVVGKLFDFVSNRKENIDAVMELVMLQKNEKHAEAVAKFLAMDETMRKDRMLNILAVQAANMSNDEVLYHKALANLDNFYNNDPSMVFLLIDYYFLEQKYDKALHALDQVQKSFGVEDAALLALKANTHMSANRFVEATRQAQRAIDIEPQYESAYWSLFNALVLNRDYVKAVTVAEQLEQGFGYDMGPESLQNVEAFVPFSASSEYRRWRNSRK